MRRAAALALCALAAAGCGSDDEQATTAAPTVATTESAPPPPAGEQQRDDSTRETTEEAGSKPPSKPYRCDGEVLRALRPGGRVRIEPNPVDAGESFRVVITDRGAEVAVVSLAGVSEEPVRADARREGGRLVATLRMPADATCGNKLVTVEGDLSAQAYVAVRR